MPLPHLDFWFASGYAPFAHETEPIPCGNHNRPFGCARPNRHERPLHFQACQAIFRFDGEQRRKCHRLSLAKRRGNLFNLFAKKIDACVQERGGFFWRECREKGKTRLQLRKLGQAGNL